MKFVEATGKTKDEAITNAILELGVPEEKVDIEVLSEGKGLFGLFSKSVKIRATLKEEDDLLEAPAKKASASEKEAVKAAAKEAVKASTNKEEKEEAVKNEIHTIEVAGTTVTGEKVILNDTIEQRLKKANAGKSEAREPREPRENRDRRERTNRGAKPAAEKDRAERFADHADHKEEAETPAPTYEPKVFEIPADAEDVKSRTCQFLKDLLAAMGIDATVIAEFSDEGIMNVDIAGDGMGLIIGKRGATLDSLQYLAALVINKDRKDHVRMKLDTEGYRARRQETLEKLAINMAKKVKRTGHRVVLEPMNPYERRIIHAALQSESGVETHSDGEEPYRKVVISPKKRH